MVKNVAETKLLQANLSMDQTDHAEKHDWKAPSRSR